VAYRLQKAGGRSDLFTEHAIDRVFEISGGIPRAINLVCQAALVYGFADEAPTINQDIVQQVAEDKVGVGPGLNPGEDDDLAPDGSAGEVSHEVLRHLQNMESEIQALRQQVESQTKVLQQKAAGSQNELVAKLDKLLHQERDRNATLMRRYNRLEMKFDALLKIKARLETERAREKKEDQKIRN
jgi:general secretion pathway protein A